MPEDGSILDVNTSTAATTGYHAAPSAFGSRNFVADTISPTHQQQPATPAQGLPPLDARNPQQSPSNPNYLYQKSDVPLTTPSQQTSNRFPPQRIPAQNFDQQNQLGAPNPAAHYQASEGSPYYSQAYYASPNPGTSYSSPDHQDVMAATQMRPPHNVYHQPQPMSPSHSHQDVAGRGIYQQSGYNPGMYIPQYGQNTQHPSYHYQHMSHGPYPSIHNTRPSYGMPGQHGSPPQPTVVDANQGIMQAPIPERSDYSQVSPTAQLPNRSPLSAPSIQSNFGGTQPSAAPGPIPATTPLKIKHDAKGVKHIEFEYSRDRIKTSHNIRCDIDTVKLETLSQKFKEDNCVYPRACGPKETYTGNRYNYETECNEIGWALAWLNQPLQGRRGLIQRAVDSWRNSSADPKMKSRRVRRLNKNQKRNQQQQQQQQNASRLPPSTGVAGNRPGLPTHRHSLTNLETAQFAQPIFSGSRSQHSASSAPASGISFHTSSQASPIPDPRHPASADTPHEHRAVHDFYPTFPHHGQMGVTQPPRPAGLEQYHAHNSPPSSQVARAVHSPQANHEFCNLSNLPDSIARKYSVSVKDNEQQRTPRVKFDIDSVDVGKIEDSYRAKTAVWPRSFVSRNPLFSDGGWALPGSTDATHGSGGSRYSHVVVEGTDGLENTVTLPGPSSDHSSKERLLNDMGSQMSHEKPRIFDQRPLLLQKTLDSCRQQISTNLLRYGEEVPVYLKQRVGKHVWHSRSRLQG